MNKSIFVLVGVAVLLTVILSGCVGNNNYTAPTTTPTDTTPNTTDVMQSATPDEVANNVSGTSGVTEAELAELDALAQDIDASSAEIQESNI